MIQRRVVLFFVVAGCCCSVRQLEHSLGVGWGVGVGVWGGGHLVYNKCVVTQPKPWWCQRILTQPKPWCSWCVQCVVTQPQTLGVLGGVSVL